MSRIPEKTTEKIIAFKFSQRFFFIKIVMKKIPIKTSKNALLFTHKKIPKNKYKIKKKPI